ncbi:unnamed protein product [Notodromas monacha]|uniref:Ig-like domain-containing protein n=1 Tax=Notodromas monacha TaxID=399045 RepID=A0A7R9BED5_9CRUS|nr:unnamed protein product [Notodromas monacha]CAG0912706.1 unnamed protein product [Notodromas monacha]
MQNEASRDCDSTVDKGRFLLFVPVAGHDTGAAVPYSPSCDEQHAADGAESSETDKSADACSVTDEAVWEIAEEACAVFSTAAYCTLVGEIMPKTRAIRPHPTPSDEKHSGDREDGENPISPRPENAVTAVVDALCRGAETELVGGPDIYVAKGSTINLTCLIKNTLLPPEAVTWYHNNKVIDYKSPRGGVSVATDKGATSSSTLVLLFARASDSGEYRCEPSNGVPAVGKIHVLNGQYPKPSVIRVESSRVTSRVGIHWTTRHVRPEYAQQYSRVFINAPYATRMPYIRPSWLRCGHLGNRRDETRRDAGRNRQQQEFRPSPAQQLYIVGVLLYTNAVQQFPSAAAAAAAAAAAGLLSVHGKIETQSRREAAG